jgi:hypothetical protein
MKCYEINTENTTYYAAVCPGRFAHDPLLAAYFNDRSTVTVYGGRFSVINADRLPTRGGFIIGESSGRMVRTSTVVSVRRISKKRFQEVS